MVIRDYSAADLEDCRGLWAELVQTHRDLYPDGAIGGTFDDHLTAYPDGRVFVAEDEGRVVGLAGLLVHGRRAELEPIVVARDRRGQGVGRALADAVVNAARAAGTIRVFVRPTARNAEAICFFHSCGFDLLGYAQLQVDFEDRERRPGERLAGREFSV